MGEVEGRRDASPVGREIVSNVARSSRRPQPDLRWRDAQTPLGGSADEQMDRPHSIAAGRDAIDQRLVCAASCSLAGRGEEGAPRFLALRLAVSPLPCRFTAPWRGRRVRGRDYGVQEAFSGRPSKTSFVKDSERFPNGSPLNGSHRRSLN
jgi:hypothetical protein